MTIDEKVLDRLDAEHDRLIQPSEFDKEIRRLARLGLWAEKHGVPTLKKISESKSMTRLAQCCVDRSCLPHEDGGSCSFQVGVNYGNCDRGAEADEALAALPKEAK